MYTEKHAKPVSYGMGEMIYVLLQSFKFPWSKSNFKIRIENITQ
jgi:hypothetical protein